MWRANGRCKVAVALEFSRLDLTGLAPVIHKRPIGWSTSERSPTSCAG
jgi:hypothetical protein